MNYLVTIAILLFFVCSVVMPVELRAQERGVGEGDVYAAPGMMVKVRRTVLIDTTAKPKPKPVLSSIILKRFWNNADIFKQAEYDAFIRELYSHIKYPSSSLRDQVEGTILLQLTVSNDGTVKDVALKKKELVWVGEASSKAKDALGEEAMRIARTLRFEPGSIASDNVTVPVKFTIQ